MSNDRTTARARRQRAVASGERETAVERQRPRNDSTDPPASSRVRQRQAAAEVASETGASREGVGTVARLDGMDVFLRSPGVDAFGDTVASDFASEADFVEPTDVAPAVDAQAITADPTVAQGRRDDVRQRARQGLAGDDPYAQPDDFDVEVGALGVESAGLTDTGARNRAGRQFESETALDAVDPMADVTETGDGFGLTTGAEQRRAARGFEDDLDVFGQGELGTGDVRNIEDGFGLAEQPARELGASRLDAEFPDVDVTPSDVQLTETSTGAFEASFEAEVSR